MDKVRHSFIHSILRNDEQRGAHSGIVMWAPRLTDTRTSIRDTLASTINKPIEPFWSNLNVLSHA